MKIRIQVVLAVALSVFAGGKARAQQNAEVAGLPDAPTPKPDAAGVPTTAQGPAGAGQQAPEKSGAQSPFNLIAAKSWFYPDLARTPGPLSAREKFELFLSTSMSPPQILASAAGAGISEARGTLSGYGQGGEGFGKRFGSSMASDASSHLFGTFLLPSALHEDPRFFVKLNGGFKGRAGHALWRVVTIRTDSGGTRFNLPGTLGPLLAEALANSYLPDSERTYGKTFQRFGIRVGFGAVNNIFKEYWPSIFKSLRMSRFAPGFQPDTTPPPPPPNRPTN
jgi:hypothetical protein